MDITASANLIIKVSTFPPKYPEIPPYKSPIGNSTKSAKKPMVIEILPPKSILENTSRPLMSVPSKYSRPAGATPIICLEQGIMPKNLYLSPRGNSFIKYFCIV